MNDDPQLERWLTNHRDAIRSGEPSNHFDIDTLARHATAQLSRAKSKAVVEHLLVCDDGRCPAFVREQLESAELAAELLYPPRTDDGGRARTFQCRDVLWEQFEEMAQELDTPLDDLLDAAMTRYAKQRAASEIPTGRRPPVSRHEVDRVMHAPPPARAAASYAPAAAPYPMDTSPHALEEALEDSRTGEAAAMGPESYSEEESYALTQARKRATAPAPPPAGSAPLRGPALRPSPSGISDHARRALPARAPATAPPPRAMAAALPPPSLAHLARPSAPPASRAPGRMSRPPDSRSAPPPLPSEPARASRAPLGARLSVEYQGESVDVTRERWIIGRSKSQADLRVDDSNVSRQHAAIERVNGVWYVVDLGSTNGVWVGGERVTRRPLVDGDVLEITTHQIRIKLGH